MQARKTQPGHAKRGERTRDPMALSVTVVRCGGLCVADPGQLDVIPRDTVTFKNRTDGPIQLYMPERLFELRGEHMPPILDIDAGGESDPYPVPAGPPRHKRTNRYFYAVYCASNERFAVGGSDPEIIVDW